jgi:hypothetical protein
MKNNIFNCILMALFLVFFITPVFSEPNKGLQIKKQPEIQQVKPKKPVRIKLKRSAEGKYTWDLSGDDVDEVVKADKRLKKLLNIE